MTCEVLWDHGICLFNCHVCPLPSSVSDCCPGEVLKTPAKLRISLVVNIVGIIKDNIRKHLNKINNTDNVIFRHFNLAMLNVMFKLFSEIK